MKHSPVEQGERLVHIAKEHWIKFVLPVLVTLLLVSISILLFFLAGLSAHHYTWLSNITFVMAVILFFVAHHWFFMFLLSEALDRIIITNRRLLRMQFRLIIQEDILEVSFEKMKTVDAIKSGMLQNLLHYGTIVFESKLASIPFVSHPNRVAQVIQHAMHDKK